MVFHVRPTATERAARALAGAVLLAGCGSPRPPVAGVSIDDPCAELSDGPACVEGAALSCGDGHTLHSDDCSARDQVCVAPGRCAACRPGVARCDAQRVLRCNDDGSVFTLSAECRAPEVCTAFGCRDLCAEARDRRSYLGCNYVASIPINSELDPTFTPALVVGNSNLVPATLVLSRAGEPAQTFALDPQSATSIPLPRDPRFDRRGSSLLARGRAYRLQADVPVTVQQWNPLEFAASCAAPDGSSEPCGSVTNDASLLVPVEALGRDDGALQFIVATRPTFAIRDASDALLGRSGFVSVVGAGAGEVEVEVVASAYTEPSASDEDEALPALAPGDSLRVRLGPGDVLQLLSAAAAPCADAPVAIQHGLSACQPSAGYDLTGTEIHADGPVAVVAGHDCTNIPYDRPACDHLEESMVPVDTWGTRSYAPRPLAFSRKPFVVQVVSAEDGNEVAFTPADTLPVRLDRGQSHSFASTAGVAVTGTRRLMVLAYLEGQGSGTSSGDPSMTLGVPPEQWRADYVFLTPATYQRSYATFIGRAGAVLMLDGDALPPLTAAPELDVGTYTATVTRPGVHTVTSSDGSPFGLQLAGVADFTSYLCPGGLDLEIVPEPG